MTALSPQQQQMLQTWAEQRDSLSREIGTYTTQCDTVRGESIQEGENLQALHMKIAEVQGRIIEISALEERMRNSTATDVAELIARKSRLEAECAAKEEESKTWDARKTEQVSAIETLVLAHNKMTDQAAIVDQVVGQVIQKSTDHLSNMRNTIEQISTAATAVINKANENVATTNIVLEKMPKFIFDMQKPIPVRRTYPVGHEKYDLNPVTNL